MKNQKIPTKPCSCGRGRVYTGERGVNLNLKVNGKIVCEECALDNIYERYFADKDKPQTTL